MEYLWDFFNEISRCRGSNGFGPSPISYRDIEAWMNLTDNKLRRWEIKALIKLDREYIAATNKAAEIRSKK